MPPHKKFAAPAQLCYHINSDTPQRPHTTAVAQTHMTYYYEARLSEEQRLLLRNTLREQGSLPLAAHVIGVSLTRLKAMAAKDEGLKTDVEDALELHAAGLYQVALTRATEGKSDALLAKLLEARVAGFAKESRETLSQRNRPTGLRLRTFTEDGEDTGVAQDIEPKAPNPPAVLTIEMQQGL